MLKAGGARQVFAHLGDKVSTDQAADAVEIETMTDLVDEAMTAGAFGLSRSRTAVDRTVHGDMTPDFGAGRDELIALARPVAQHVLQLAARVDQTPKSFTYDMMLQTSRHRRLLLAINNYVDGGLDRIKPMLEHPAAVWERRMPVPTS